MTAKLILALLALLPLAALSFGEEPADPPIKRDANGERIWELTDYLKGTRFQIQDKMNGEVVRLTDKKDELTKVLAGENADLIRDRDAYVNRRKKEPDFVAAQAALDAAEASLAKARANFDETTVANERTRFFAAKGVVTKMTLDAISSAMRHDDVQDDKKRLAGAEKDLARIKEALDKATKWREELRVAMRNTFQLEWPLGRGRTGILGNVVVEARGIVKFDCRETTEAKATSEGIVATKAFIHTVRLVVVEQNDAALQKPGPIRFDKAVEVISTEYDDKHGEFTLVKLKHTDVDDLMEAVNSNEMSKRGNQPKDAPKSP